MICIIVEIVHTIILLFIWLSLTLKNDWNMHLQTAYSVCHWTWHLKLKETNQARVDYQQQIKSISGQTIQDKPDRNLNYPNNPQKYYSPKISAHHYNSDPHIPNYVDQRQQQNQQQQQQQQLHLRSNQFNHNQSSNIINRSLVEKKHQSLFVENSESYQTVYRNEIRKSIRNILEKSSSTSGSRYPHKYNPSGATAITSFNGVITNGVYLTSSGPQCVDTLKRLNDDIDDDKRLATSSRSVLYLDSRESAIEYESRV
jgi:type II secretory pathway pseudopilin PulG